MIDAMSNRTVKVIFSNRKEFEFLVKSRKKFLMEILMEGLSKNNVANILMSKEPTPVHTSSMKKMGMDSKMNKPINPIIIAKRTRINKKAQTNISSNMYICIDANIVRAETLHISW